MNRTRSKLAPLNRTTQPTITPLNRPLHHSTPTITPLNRPTPLNPDHYTTQPRPSLYSTDHHSTQLTITLLNRPSLYSTDHHPTHIRHHSRHSPSQHCVQQDSHAPHVNGCIIALFLQDLRKMKPQLSNTPNMNGIV